VPSNKVRLFPNDARIRFSNPIHEMVEPSLERLNIRYIDVDGVWVHHYGYLDETRQKNKLEQYYLLGLKKLEESGGEPKAICELAIQAAEIGRYEEAFDLWQQALAIDPVSWLAWFNLGSVCLRLGRFEEARDASRRAAELKENFFEAVSNQAFAELCIGSAETAERLTSDSLRRNPDYPFLELMLAITKTCRGQDTEAREIFTHLRETHIDFSTFLGEVAEKLEMAGRREQAVRLRQVSQQRW
jgi:tetratricopeptide (TPR) repeat protein